MISAPVEAPPVHLVGIAGAGMSALARLLLEAGHQVSGSDQVERPALNPLRELGVRIWIGHDPGKLERPGRIVVSPAVPADNVELRAARAAGVAVQTRAQALAELLGARPAVAVAGSHGKTTTAAMLAFILGRAGRNPGYYLGGISASLDRVSARLARGSLFVLEACEAFGAMESWRPSHCLITNIDDEHAEHYGGEEGLRQAFARLLARTPETGVVVLGVDDPGAAALGEARSGRVTTFGLGGGADVRGTPTCLEQRASRFAVSCWGERLGEVSLSLPGLHNVRNALGAAAMALELGVGFETIAAALADFSGVDRRWRAVGEAGGVKLFDDFAHHPAQIAAATALAREELGIGGKLVIAWAPQLHSGIPRLARRFGEALSAADLVLLAPMVSPDERPGLAAGFEQLAGAVQATGVALVRVAGIEQLALAAIDHLGPGDVLVTIGPDGVEIAGRQVLEGLRERPADEGGQAGSISQGRVTGAPDPPCLASRILDHAERRPDAPAHRCGEALLTYAGLARRAVRLADALADEGLVEGEAVAVSLNRSVWRSAAFLGVLLAGGVCLPIDPALPKKRKRFMARDARVRFAVASAGAAQAFDAAVRVIAPDAPTQESARPSRSRPARTGAEAAYVIYTSGTTGQPKGVVVEHRSLANFAVSAAAAFEIDETSRVSNASAFGFDVAVGEMAMTLASGACLVTPPDEAALGGPPLGRLVRDAGVTHLVMTPSALATLPAYDYPALSHVIVAGEACPPDLAERWGTGRAFFNGYGPTEATVLATLDRHVPGQTITIGRAMDNACALILGDDGAPVRRGVAGELWLSGMGVARGYLRRKELTAERFRTLRLDGGKPVRAYRTGDLAVMLPDGRIRFLGRADDQVKLRGFRIELGEIEACLRGHVEVNDAAVDLRRDAAGQDRLVAYVVPADPAAPPSVEALEQHLAARLPAHMTPAAFVAIGAVPLSPNGKRDRSQLPDPPGRVIRRRGPAEPPAAGVETALHELFRRELAIDGEFGVRDTLIDLGADSLRTANLFMAVEARFGVELPLEAAAQDETVELLALRIGRLLASPPPPPNRSLAATLIRTQMTYLAAWTGSRRSPESLIFTRGDGRGRPPLFWCFQGSEEHERLSAQLGPGVALHGMRSGHLVFQYTPENVAALASRYVDEVLTLQPEGPVWIGGNCQGGIIAQEIVRQLMGQGRDVAMLFLLDPGRFPPMPAPVSLIFGATSELNPYLGAGAPDRVFDAAYPAGYRVDFLPGAHGIYFESPAVEALAGLIESRLPAAVPANAVAESA